MSQSTLLAQSARALNSPYQSDKSLTLLSGLTLSPDTHFDSSFLVHNEAEFQRTLALASDHHVVVRAFEVLERYAKQEGNSELAGWCSSAVAQERNRVANAVAVLTNVCAGFKDGGLGVMVIKSLDHWPDLGSDVDLFTDASPSAVINLMQTRFHAEVADRSWGDRLANKWNFNVPGLPEAIEIHIGKMGQTGEQISIAGALIGRSRVITVDNRSFRTTSPEDRIIICTLQRMYRHFYARLCDIVDTAELIEARLLDFKKLEFIAEAAGIWAGVSTFLVIVSDYVRHFRGEGLDLPGLVVNAARFGGSEIKFARGFLRIPILPHSAKLYTSQLTNLIRNGELRSTARLVLLPGLATAAAIGQKITGSDKGIW